MRIEKNKQLVRLLMFFILLAYGFLLIVSAGDLGPEIERLQERFLFVRVMLAVIGILGAISVFLVWGLMFYHWGTHGFIKKGYKLLWFLVMAVGMFVGSWIYYIVVFELKKTVVEKDE